jgi:hypothetical protein
MLREGGREDGVIMVEGDSEDHVRSRRAQGRVVWGVCGEEGGGHDIYLFLVRSLVG